MADQTNPFASYSPEDQAEIRRQLVDMSSSGQLNDAQKRGVALALTQMGAASGFPSTSQPNATAEPPSLWNKANTGLVNPDTILKLASIPLTGAPRASQALAKKLGINTPLSNVDLTTPTTADLLKTSKGDPSLGPVANAVLSGTTGAAADTANTVSGLTSPISIATLAAGPFSKGAGVVPKTLRTLMTALGLTFGAQGVGNVAEGVGQDVTTPEGAQKTLGGLAQVAGAAPAVGELGTAIKGAAQHLVPQAFAEGQNAFIRTIQPDRKAVPALRDAYNIAAPKLAAAPIKDLPDLESFANVQREQAAQELMQRVKVISPDAGTISMKLASRNIRSKITEAMKLGVPVVGVREPGPDIPSAIVDENGRAIMHPGDPGSTGKPGAEVKVIADYAERVANGKPLSLVEAERIVQQLNARTTQFDRLPPEAQRTLLANGDPVLAEKGLKESLQDQIEQRMGNYRDLKAQYGAWKEIQNQTNNQMDKLARQSPQATWLQRRGLESILGMGGALFGGMHGGAEGTVGGGLLGYLAGKAAAEIYLNKLASPERMMQRAIRPQPVAARPIIGPALQQGAQSLIAGGGTAF